MHIFSLEMGLENWKIPGLIALFECVGILYETQRVLQGEQNQTKKHASMVKSQ